MARLVEEYHRLTQMIREAEQKRNRIKSALKAYMEKKGQDEIRAGHLRALRYAYRTITWDVQALRTLLRERGIAEEFLGHIFVVAVNEHAVMQLVEDGLVSMEDVHKVAKVRTGHGFRIDEVKEE